MQIIERGHYPRATGDYTVELNPGRGRPFAQITLDEDGKLALNMLSVDDCDRMIKAAAAAKALLIEHAGDKDKPHQHHAARGDTCLICGKPEDEHGEEPYPPPAPVGLCARNEDGSHAAPACGSESDEGATVCVLPAGHDGPHNDVPLPRIVEADGDPDDVMETGSPGMCKAMAGCVDASGDRSYCWRPDGHDGPHYDEVDKLHWLELEPEAPHVPNHDDDCNGDCAAFYAERNKS